MMIFMAVHFWRIRKDGGISGPLEKNHARLFQTYYRLFIPDDQFFYPNVVTPPTDWFDRLNRKLGFHLLWTHTGLAIAMLVITAFFAIGYMDENFSIILMKGDNFPIVLMVYTIYYFTWLAMRKAYINDERLEKGLKAI